MPTKPKTIGMRREPLLPLTETALQEWKARIDDARTLRKKRRDIWKECLQTYLGKPLLQAPDHDLVLVNKEFPFVEQKKAQLMFQVPEVQLKPLQPGAEQTARLFQAVVNFELGDCGADVVTTLDETLTDSLIMGIGPTKIGYSVAVGSRPISQPVLNLVTGTPEVGPDGAPLMQTVEEPYILSERYFWNHVAPDKFLLPAEFEGLDFDRASWQAFEFEKPVDVAIKEFGLPEEFSGTVVSEDDSLSGEKEGLEHRMVTKKVTGVELWYRAALFTDEPHPDKIRLLVLVDGHDKPVRHRESPYQRMSPDGRLFGMEGFPMHPLVLRHAPGCAYPPSDVELSIHISEELSKGRTQMVQQRETSIPMRWADRNKLDPDTLTKILRGTWQGIIPLDGNGNEALGEVARANFPRENFSFNDIADRDYEEMWALGRVQRGLTEDESRTATEINAAQGAASVRLDKERARVLKWFVTGAQKFASLLQLFKTDPGFVEILGPDGAGQLQQWDRDAIQGKFLFQAKPDSALRMDAQAERKQALDLYNLLGNDPNVVRVELLRSILQKYNMDPSRIVVDKLPEKGPEPPKITLSFKGEDLLLPSVVAFLAANGVTMPPETAQMAQMADQVRSMVVPEHGGAAQQANPISKHALRGGGLPGVGQR